MTNRERDRSKKGRSWDDMPVGKETSEFDFNMNVTEEDEYPYLVEVKECRNENPGATIERFSDRFAGLAEVDSEYKPKPVPIDEDERAEMGLDDSEEIVVLRVFLDDPNKESELKECEGVLKDGVWADTRSIGPFADGTDGDLIGPTNWVQNESVDYTGEGVCLDSALGTIRSDSNKPSVAEHLGIDEIHRSGYKGNGIVVGVVDGGITAESKRDEINPDDLNSPRWPGKLIENVDDGFLADWGTTGSPYTWGWHGNMCARDVLAMAPEARIYDIRLEGQPSFASSLLSAFDWAIEKYNKTGKPDILTVSAGLFMKNWDPALAENINHPTTRTIAHAIEIGIIVLFAGGNCGQKCPDRRCSSRTESDTGPNKSIWGPNGHPDVITVGGATIADERVGYSSQGPSSLDPEGIKPDFCSITDFEGYFGPDTPGPKRDGGTSAATPIAAGVVACLLQLAKNNNKELTQSEIKAILSDTARDMGAVGPDNNTGSGVLDAKAAFDDISPSPTHPDKPEEWIAENRITGDLIYPPAAVSSHSERIDLFMVGPDSHLYQKTFRNGRWTYSEKVDKSFLCASSPAVASRGSGRFDIVVLGADQDLYWTRVDGQKKIGEWTNIGGKPCLFDPQIITRSGEVLEVYAVRGEEGERYLYRKQYQNGSWNRGWERIGGICTSAPAVIARSGGRVDVFVRGPDGIPYWIKDVDVNREFEPLGGTVLTPGLAAASREKSEVDLFAIGFQGSLYRKKQRGDVWGEWERVGGTWLDFPAAVASSRKSIDIFVIDTVTDLYQKRLSKL